MAQERIFSIETAILQKRLIFDNSLIESTPTIYNFTDLKSCYDRQLANVGSIVEESVGRNRAAMKLHTKIMPKFKRYISTGYGISNQYYGGDEMQLAGTGQGNKFSGDVCRDVSCIIIKVIENKRLGVFFTNKESGEAIQCVSVAFVDDTDFMTNGENALNKMSEIISTYDRLHGATGGLIELFKTKYYSWIWKWKQGQKRIVNVESDLTIQNKQIKKENVKESVLTLGVHMNPMMSWDKQFEMMKEKLHRAISKLRGTPISVGNAYVFVNMYLISQVCFGTGIIAINKKQEDELKRISEPTLLRKLGLSEKFPRKILHTKKSQLGVGILQPSTIIAMLSLKLYFGHKRYQDNIGRQIGINEINAQHQCGYRNDILKIKEEFKPNNKIWSDEIGSRLMHRAIKIVNGKEEKHANTQNKTIMDYAVEYVRSNELEPNIIAPINHVRMWKKMTLPCELIGFTGTKETTACLKADAKSSLRWSTQFPEINKPSKKSIIIWSSFITWLKGNKIDTILDFCDKCNSTCQISHDKRYLKEHNNNGPLCYEKEDEQYGRNKYRRILECNTQDWRRVIGNLEVNGFMKIESEFPPEWALHQNINNEQHGGRMPEKIKESIENETAHAASDASLKCGRMGGHWVITDQKNEEVIENTLYHKAWRNNTIKGAEAIVLLELVMVLHKRGRNVTQGKICVSIDNKKVFDGVTKTIVKASTYTQDAGAEIAQIRRLVKEMKFQIEFKLVKIKKGTHSCYSVNPGDCMMKICDKKAQAMRRKCYRYEPDTNIQHVGLYSLNINGEISTNSIKEAIRKRDAEMIFKDYTEDKFGHNIDIVDIEARNSFKHNEITPSVIKCAHGHNHYGLRDALINGKIVGMECPRCGIDETWDHVIRCRKIRHKQIKFVKDIEKDVIAVNEGKIDEEVIVDMIEDIAGYLYGCEEDEYATTQQYIGFKELFRGYVVKDWIGTDFNCTKYSELNKIIVVHAVKFYNECWKHRNEVFHNEKLQRVRMIKWYEKLKEEVEMNDPPQVKLFAQRTALDVERSNTETIKMWIQNVKELQRKVEKLPKGDIRRFCEV